MRRTHFTCTIEGCCEPHKAHGLCNTHFQRTRSGTDLAKPIESKHPGEWGVWQMKSGYRYRVRRIGGQTEFQLEHRVVMEQAIGRPLLREETVHHINGIRTDNRIKNLELWSSSHPSGQRVSDKLKWAREMIELYS